MMSRPWEEGGLHIRLRAYKIWKKLKGCHMSWLLLKFPCLHWFRREGYENSSPRGLPAQHLIYRCQCWYPLVCLFYLWNRMKNVKVTIQETDKHENLASHLSCTETLIFAICYSLYQKGNEKMVWGATL